MTVPAAPGGWAPLRWRSAMDRALYGPDGFFTRPGPGPAGHFRTSAHASPLFALAVVRLLAHVDRLLARPDPLDLVDVGAGRGELLQAVLAALPASMAGRVRATGVELAPRPPGLGAGIGWVPAAPAGTVGLLVATEWLDNVALDVVSVDAAGTPRYVLVDHAGHERAGDPVDAGDAAWLARWWPLDGAEPGVRAEVGRTRDEAWTGVLSTVERGLAVAADYGHLRDSRPEYGTLTGYREGRQVPPVPDGSGDLTAHVAVDAVAEAGVRLSGVPPHLLTQRTALHALGVHGRRPPLGLANRDPGRYVRELAAASAAAELTDRSGLGGHYWLVQPLGLAPDAPVWPPDLAQAPAGPATTARAR